MEKKYVVYQHVTPDGLYYFGTTSNIKRRWEGNGKGYKGTSLQPYIEKYGWDNIKHIVLFRDKTKEDALWIEGFLIETAREDGVCINKNRSGDVSKEEDYQREYYEKYREKNREKLNEYQRDYYEKNREKFNEYQRDYYEKNREKFNEYQRDYYEKNREKLNEYQREYKRKYREKYREKFNEYQREYQRQYRRRKKEEKQLKEVETTPLF